MTREGRLNRSGDGYLEVRSGDGRSVYVHRLVAFAHGSIRSLADPRQVHHRNGLLDVNSPENLQAVDHPAHARFHLNETALAGD